MLELCNKKVDNGKVHLMSNVTKCHYSITWLNNKQAKLLAKTFNQLKQYNISFIAYNKLIGESVFEPQCHELIQIGRNKPKCPRDLDLSSQFAKTTHEPWQSYAQPTVIYKQQQY